jgi:alkyl sulfatase BDS1-like metallo-beta-lactamase superfamily hydrolase
VLHHTPGADAKADVTLTIAKQVLDRIQLRQTTLQQALGSGSAHLDGRREAFGEFMALLDDFPYWFNIVTP